MGDTRRGIGRVGPDREVDWAGHPPPALLALRRSELRQVRRAAVAKAVGSLGLLGACVAMVAFAVMGHRLNGLGVAGLLAIWGARSLIPSIAEVRSTTHQLAALEPPGLPEARVVTR